MNTDLAWYRPRWHVPMDSKLHCLLSRTLTTVAMSYISLRFLLFKCGNRIWQCDHINCTRTLHTRNTPASSVIANTNLYERDSGEFATSSRTWTLLSCISSRPYGTSECAYSTGGIDKTRLCGSASWQPHYILSIFHHKHFH